MAEKGKRGRGRPAGSRNKSKLIKAQLKFDDASELAAETLKALMKNDKEFLNISDDVPATIRLQACKVILDKAIANEKDKDTQAPVQETVQETVQDSIPRVVSSVK